MTTDTSEKGLETLIMRHMTGTVGLAAQSNTIAKPPTPYGGTGYSAGRAKDYDRAHALDVPKLFDFLLSTRFQEDVPLSMFVFPVDPLAELPPEFDEFAVVPEKPLALPPQQIAANRDRWIKEWTATVLR